MRRPSAIVIAALMLACGAAESPEPAPRGATDPAAEPAAETEPAVDPREALRVQASPDDANQAHTQSNDQGSPRAHRVPGSYPAVRLC